MMYRHIDPINAKPMLSHISPPLHPNKLSPSLRMIFKLCTPVCVVLLSLDRDIYTKYDIIILLVTKSVVTLHFYVHKSVIHYFVASKYSLRLPCKVIIIAVL